MGHNLHLHAVLPEQRGGGGGEASIVGNDAPVLRGHGHSRSFCERRGADGVPGDGYEVEAPGVRVRLPVKKDGAGRDHAVEQERYDTRERGRES